METIYEEDFERLVLRAEHPVAVDFYADWSGQCQALAPVLEQLERCNDNFSFYRVNVDECHELAVRYKVFTLPTVVYFKGGRAIAQTIGLKPAEELQKVLDGFQ